MTPRRTDPFAPDEGAEYSRNQVKQAGRFIRKKVAAAPEPLGIGESDKLAEAFTILEWWRRCHARPLSNVAAMLRYHVRQEIAADREVEVAQRLKKRNTMISKLLREPTMSLATMHDIGGVRAVVADPAELRAVSRRLKKTWKASIVKSWDYMDGPPGPKDSGYRAIHHSVRNKGFLVEVQLRTELQDVWANQVEEDGRDRKVWFKFGYGEEEIHDYYRTMAQVLACLDLGSEIPAELAAELNRRRRVARPMLGVDG